MKKLLLVLLFIFPTLSWGQTTNFITPNDFGMPTYSYPFTRFWLRGSIPAGSNPAMDFHGRYRFTFYCDTMEFTTLYARLNASPQRIVTIGSDGTLSSYDPNFLTSQTQADWNATSGAAFIQNKPALNVTNWNNAYSWGDWRLENFLHTSDTANHWLSNTYVPDWASITGKPTIPTNTNQLTNGAGFLTSESDPLFDTKFATKTTTDLTEGTNLYWTGARFTSALTSGAIATALSYTPQPQLTGTGYVKSAAGVISYDNSTFLTAEVDGSITNEIQTLSLSNRTVSLTLGGSVTLPLPNWDSTVNKPTTLSGYGITDGVTTSSLTSTLSGYVPTTRTISINGTSQDLSANRTWTNIGIELPSQTGNNGKVLSTNGTAVSWTTPTAGSVTSVGLTSTDFSISGSPVTSSGNITANLNTSGVSAGTYNGSYTVNNKGIVTAATNVSFNNSPTLTLGTSKQISTTNNARVSYTISLTTAVSLLNLNSTAQAFLEISSNNSTWVTIAGGGSTQTLAVALSVGLNVTTLQNLQCEVPAGYWVRVRAVTAGTGSAASFSSGQETIY